MIQLFGAFFGGAIVFMLAYIVPERKVVALLILLIPFQIISSRYGSLNMALTFFVGLAYFMRGRLHYMPLLGSMFFILASYAIALVAAEGNYFRHLVYLVSMVSCFLMFYIVYNTIYNMGSQGVMYFWRLLAILNVLVLIYCALQLLAGLTGGISFGIEEFSMNQVRGDDRRLNGPFSATALTAEYFNIQSVILLYTIMEKGSKKWLWWGLFIANSLFLVTTGNRGGIVVQILALLLYFWMYRSSYSKAALMRIGAGAVIFFIAAALVVVKYSEFNVLFERVEQTEFDGYVPDTRSGWNEMIPIIFEKPVYGHGPYLKAGSPTGDNVRVIDRTLPYPHNLYFYIIYTIGLLGLLAYGVFFIRLFSRFRSVIKKRVSDRFINGIPKLGIIILVIIAVSQIRIEMFRFITMDYVQYVFMMLGGLLAITSIKKKLYMNETLHKNNNL